GHGVVEEIRRGHAEETGQAWACPETETVPASGLIGAARLLASEHAGVDEVEKLSFQAQRDTLVGKLIAGFDSTDAGHEAAPPVTAAA
ncbi:hypothetical protein, partial [Streptomyces sp. KE1]|uniref:hypothetical protein n=1 Tax=Streptomyces sp. KE1 TaxID=1638939 RepID=UPI001F2D06D4